jgi:hypothetical protein
VPDTPKCRYPIVPPPANPSIHRSVISSPALLSPRQRPVNRNRPRRRPFIGLKTAGLSWRRRTKPTAAEAAYHWPSFGSSRVPRASDCNENVRAYCVTAPSLGMAELLLHEAGAVGVTSPEPIGTKRYYPLKTGGPLPGSRRTD